MQNFLSAKPDGPSALPAGQLKASELLSKPEIEQQSQGYFHTLREICQQPATLLATCESMLAHRDKLKQLTAGIRALLLTGSGSSEYVGECVRFPLQN